MGAALSDTLRNYVLRGWDAEGHAPRDVENRARVLMRYAFLLAEVYPPAHCREGAGSPWSAGAGKRPRRPLWLEPSLLHVLLVSSSPKLAETVLDGLRAAAPLAEVLSDPHARDGGACAAASKAGFRSHAFIDAELRALRLWSIGEGDLRADVATDDDVHGSTRLPHFDLLVWLVGEADEQAALPEAAPAAAGASSGLGSAGVRLTQELEEARAAKRTAIQAEEFAEAQSWKAREAELAAKLQALEAAGGAAEEERLLKVLEEARAAKQAAVAAEEFKDAQQWKAKEKDLEAQLAALTLAAEPAARAGPAAPASGGSWRERLGALAGEGRPPVLIVGFPGAPFSLRTEAVHAGLPPDRIWALPQMEPGQRPGLCAEGGFWAVAEAVIRLVSAGRAFPAELPPIQLPGDMKLGAPVRLRHMEVRPGGPKFQAGGAELAARPEELSGRCGTVVGYAGDAPIPPSLFLVRLWDGEVARVVREQMTLLSFKLGASSPVQLTNMERMIVRLRNLKAKPELNGREGETEERLTAEGRYTVVFRQGGHVAVKPENVEVIEPASPELQAQVGLVDARDGARGRYKVLLVKTTDRTEERSEVRLHGLQAKPALNGQEAVIDTYNPQTERFTVRLKSDGSEIAIRRQNFEFVKPVRIEALSLNLLADRVDYFLDPDDEEMLCNK